MTTLVYCTLQNMILRR